MSKIYTQIPAITGKQLITLLTKGGWIEGGHTTHGVSLTKKTTDRMLVTVVPNGSESLPMGTLQAILGVKQTRLGKSGLLELLNLYGK